MTGFDWEAAARRAAQLAPAGRTTSPARIRGLVHSLREAAVAALPMVGEITGLGSAAEAAAGNTVYVVDRARWAEANAQTFAVYSGDADGDDGFWSSRSTVEEVGVVLALLSPRVLGQFDPFTGSRLLLVAPNILAAEREHAVDAMDFRLWVCLHEQTHAVQFAAAPWLAEYIGERIAALTGSMGEREEASLLTDFAGAIGTAVRGESQGDVITSALTESERVEFDALIATMSLLEGHADVVMDAVGPERIPGIKRIRARFDQKRGGSSRGLGSMMKKMLGLDMKLAQYRDGAVFVRAVIDELGHEGLNAVWAAPENLPSAAEIAEPELWLARVHG
ncbi:putative hydrolase/uncharacterized protein, coenzyme F420 biosynthesis associated [Ruaniaceae bacterium KH17]|nr:putative hydrolase/uncharacterized protein, coenzyme F420 biosynthesis associated [Ruaniaceae bacterium KH17]